MRLVGVVALVLASVAMAGCSSSPINSVSGSGATPQPATISQPPADVNAQDSAITEQPLTQPSTQPAALVASGQPTPAQPKVMASQTPSLALPTETPVAVAPPVAPTPVAQAPVVSAECAANPYLASCPYTPVTTQ